MSLQTAQAFREHVSADPALQAAIRQCLSPAGVFDPAAIVAVGQRNGFQFSTADVDAVLTGDDTELSDFELELVSAGIPSDCGSYSTHM